MFRDFQGARVRVCLCPSIPVSLSVLDAVRGWCWSKILVFALGINRKGRGQARQGGDWSFDSYAR
jgi:hypothetical protein